MSTDDDRTTSHGEGTRGDSDSDSPNMNAVRVSGEDVAIVSRLGNEKLNRYSRDHCY